MTEEKKSIQFTCPKCRGHRLGQVNQVFMTYPMIDIPLNEDEYDCGYDDKNTVVGDKGTIVAHQCMDCGLELRNKFDETIDDVYTAIDWIRENCKLMTKKYKVVNDSDLNQEQEVDGKNWEEASNNALTSLGWRLVEYEEEVE